MITTYNTAVTDAVSEILEKERRRKKPWVTRGAINVCDEWRNLNKYGNCPKFNWGDFVLQCTVKHLFLAYRIRISACFTWTDNSYLTHVISPKTG